MCGSWSVGRSANESEGLDTGMRGGGRVVDVGVRGMNEGREMVGRSGEVAVDEGGRVEGYHEGARKRPPREPKVGPTLSHVNIVDR